MYRSQSYFTSKFVYQAPLVVTTKPSQFVTIQRPQPVVTQKYPPVQTSGVQLRQISQQSKKIQRERLNNEKRFVLVTDDSSPLIVVPHNQIFKRPRRKISAKINKKQE